MPSLLYVVCGACLFWAWFGIVVGISRVLFLNPGQATGRDASEAIAHRGFPAGFVALIGIALGQYIAIAVANRLGISHWAFLVLAFVSLVLWFMLTRMMRRTCIRAAALQPSRTDVLVGISTAIQIIQLVNLIGIPVMSIVIWFVFSAS